MALRQTFPSPQVDPPALHVHAANDLRFIRQTMERSSRFTAVPGWGTIAMGATALLTAGLVMWFGPENPFTFWTIEAVPAVAIGFVSMAYKARLVKDSLFSNSGGRFMLNLFVPIAAGVPLTFVLYQRGLEDLLPGLWLLLYGIGVVTGGAFSVRVVPIMGFCFMLTGIASIFAAPHWGNLFLATGFGLIHILFGSIIVWKHGG